MVGIRDIAREDVSKGLGVLQWVCYTDLGQHVIIARVYTGLGHKSTGN